jgi:NADH-quinone oxidoreductase subunit H
MIPEPKVFWIASFIKMFAIVFGLVNVGALLLWVERRQSALMQDRMGPNRAAIKLFGREFRLIGLLHSAADGIKMIFKEDFVPPNADKLLYRMAPIIALIPPLALFVVIPFGPTIYWQNRGSVFGLTEDFLRDHPAGIQNLLAIGDVCAQQDASGACTQLGAHVLGGHFFSPIAWQNVAAIPLQIDMNSSGILVIFALASSGVLGAALAGIASDNKFSLMGGLRAASQMVSYEVTLGLSLVGAFMVYQTVQLQEMVQWQAEHVWGVITQPLAFFIFFAASIAETKRVPFDAPEGESEIVAGYFTEYTVMKMGMFALGELVEVVTSSALLVTIFLGGWQFPFVQNAGFFFDHFGLHIHWYWSHLAVVIAGALTFPLKVLLVVFLQMTIRWTLPRFRYDQIMKLGWQVLLPLSLLNIFITGVVLLFVNNQVH